MEVLKLFKNKKNKEQNFLVYPDNPEIKIPKEFDTVQKYWDFLDHVEKVYGVKLDFSYRIDKGKIYVTQEDLITHEIKNNNENGISTYRSMGETLAGDTKTIDLKDLPIAIVVGLGLFYISKSENSDSIYLHEEGPIKHQIELREGQTVAIGNQQNENPNHFVLEQNFVSLSHMLIKYKNQQIQILDTASVEGCKTQYYSYAIPPQKEDAKETDK